MRRTGLQLPVITIDPDLIKSTAERNKGNVSPIGEMFGFRTPLNINLEKLRVPKFTSTEQPDDSDREIDYTTPLAELIKPRKDLLKTPSQIENWLNANVHQLGRPMQYIGREANTDSPDLFEASDLRVLIVRLSSYDSVNGSLTHGALSQLVHSTAREKGFKAYVDHSYMPGLSGDAEFLRDSKVPWLYARTSRRHPRDFDVILFSFALTMEIWNIIPALVYSGISPFKTMRDMDKPLNDRDQDPVIIFGGVVSDFIESLYGEVEGHRCVCDATLIGDGEFTLPKITNLLHKTLKEGKTRKDFLRAGHDLPEDQDFERDGKGTKFSWWYEPDLYDHVYEQAPTETVWYEHEVLAKDPKTGEVTETVPKEHRIKYKELINIKRKPGFDYAAAPGAIKRAIMRDLNKTPVWEETPIQYDGSLGPAVDIQISSGCLCVAGDTVIETDMGFETIEECYERLQDENEVGGVLVQTRQGLQGAESIVKTGNKKVRTYVFRTEDGKQELSITCTDEHKFDTSIQGDSEPAWVEAKDLRVGQEIWAVDPIKYVETRNAKGRNTLSQHYYAEQVTLELKEVSDYFEAICYDVYNCDIHEYIANGLITHNSGGLCSFCLAEGTKISVSGYNQVNIEDLCDDTHMNLEDRELDTPFGLQVPKGIVYTGEKECYELETGFGQKLQLTLDHEILTYRKGLIQKVKVKDLDLEKDIAIMVQPITGVSIAKQDGRRDFLYPPALRPGAKKNKEILAQGGDNVLQKDEITADQRKWFTVLRKINAYADKIISIKPVGTKKVYDVWNIENGHVFYANGFVVGNCHEAHTQGRWRERSLDVIKDAAERAVRKQGAQEVSFYSLTWSLHSQIYSLLLWCYERFGDTNLISQRADQASADPDFFKFQNANGERSATVGVEGISQRMRNYFNKSLHTNQLLQMCENAARAGYQSLKFFMILAGVETAEDVQEFCELMRELSRRFKKIAKERSLIENRDVSPCRINPSFMLLLNLPHTALQWAPCGSSYDLESDTLRPLVDTTRECGFGFRTSMTRERVRISQVSGMWGREATAILIDTGLRSFFQYYGPVPKRVTYLLDKKIQEYGYDWNYYVREKDWNHLFPWDHIATGMRRDYLWNQWVTVRNYVGAAYCLRTSVNPNPKCHDCGACGTAADRQFMLTRDIEDANKLTGKEASRRDMTIRKRVRWAVDINDNLLRLAPKDILARNLVRAFMLASSEVNFDNEIVKSYLRIDGTSMKHAEGKGNLPWVKGRVLIDTVFNKNWKDDEMKSLIPRINEIMKDSWPTGKTGMSVQDFVSSDKLVYFDNKAYALYTLEMPLSAHDLQVKLEEFAEKEDITYKERKTVGRDIFRMEEVTKIRSEVVPMAYMEPTKTGTRLTFLCNLTSNPIQILTILTGKRAVFLKPIPIVCLGYYRYDREKVDDGYGVRQDDLFAALEGRSVYCEITGEPIETDVFTGETYRSQTAPGLCLAADLKGLMKMKDFGIDGTGATVTL